jgi:chorismate synthase
VGSIARKFLEEFGITVGSYVESIGGVYSDGKQIESLVKNKLPKNFTAWNFSAKADKSSVRVLDKNHEERIIRQIKKAKKTGDTLGGSFVTVASGVPPGLGSFVHYDRKLNAAIAQSIMSINAVKAVELGPGFDSAEKFGSEVHDEIILKRNSFSRKTNRAGGIEGGISTGLPIVVRAAMKPIATLMRPLQSVDLKTIKNVKARRERSDFVAVPACAVISESMLAWTIAEFFLLKFGGDSIEETMDNYNSYTKKLQSRIRRNFNKK